MTGASQGAVTLDKISKRYGRAHAIREVSLDVAPGRFVTLLGPSGSGKTTTLMAIAGFVQPSSGRILMNGADITRLPPNRRDLGMVFQHYALFPNMTVAQNVAYPLKVRRRPAEEIARRVRAALEMVKLEDFGDRAPVKLSGGQQQRVALARAIVFRPDVLLMDEPLGALDKNLRDHMQTEIRRIHRQLGATVFYVTHDQDEALSMSDVVVVMRDGAIAQIGAPEELYERPATAFVAKFIGGANVLAGASEGGQGGRALLRHGSGQPILAPAGEVSGRAEIAVRPERIGLGLPDPARGETGLSATLTEVTYGGAVTRIAAEAGGEEIAAVLPRAHVADLPEPGAAIALKWAADDAVLLHPEAEQ
ncbi:MAG: ABC transporter ATP-binding protein [Pseudomonadota bacterium]|nr:ABC transporter ATP-binding protein [Pseudomonadota bacterium]